MSMGFRVGQSNARWSPFAGALVLSALVAGAGCPDPMMNDPDPVPTAELGYTDLTTDAYSPVPNGATMPLYTGGQGGSHIYATLRATGFPAGGDGTVSIQLAQTATRVSNGTLLHDFAQPVVFVPLGDGQFEVKSRFVFLDALPADLDGQAVHFVFVLTATDQPDKTVRIDETLNVDLQP